jgi:hypothetical protein
MIKNQAETMIAHIKKAADDQSEETEEESACLQHRENVAYTIVI